MARFGRLRRPQEEEPDINMIPIMNMFMVLIPFLLMSASFFHIKAINTSVPVHADKPAKMLSEKEKPKLKITVVLCTRWCLIKVLPKGLLLIHIVKVLLHQMREQLLMI